MLPSYFDISCDYGLLLQSEVNELLALVYYDSIQNVVPSYDQRRHVPVHDAAWIAACKNSLSHFEVAYSFKYVILLHFVSSNVNMINDHDIFKI